MRPAGYFPERIGRGNGNSDRRNHPSFHDAESEQRRAESPDQRLEGLREFGCLKILGSHVVSEQGGGCKDRCDRSCRSQSSPYYRVDATKADIFLGKSLVNCCALLKEKHPWGYGCTNVSQHDEQSIFAQAAGKRLPGDYGSADRVPIRVCEQGNWNEHEIEYGNSEQGSFPRPIAVGYYGQTQERQCTKDRGLRGYAKKSQAGADGNELSDQCQKIPNAQVDH
jgi:hypothetical protein